MLNLDLVLQLIDARLAKKNEIREEALKSSRAVIQQASKVIRAIHRREWDDARHLLDETTSMGRQMNELAMSMPDIYWTGYVQDAQKELVEAHLTYALIRQTPLPTPEALAVEDASYLHGLAEAASELRRYLLDLVRENQLKEADELLETMEEVYSYLITIDYPHAITNNLRRTTDILRAVLERSRGDVTMAMKQQALQSALQRMETKLLGGGSILST